MGGTCLAPLPASQPPWWRSVRSTFKLGMASQHNCRRPGCAHHDLRGTRGHVRPGPQAA